MKEGTVHCPRLGVPGLAGVRYVQEQYALKHGGDMPHTVVLCATDFARVKEEVETTVVRQMFFSGKDSVRYRYSRIEESA